MEFAGADAAQLMHIWIRDEYANITSKRDRGIWNLGEERRIRQELQLPEFNGSNLDDWIFQLEDSFHFFQLDEEAKFKAAIISLVGDALRWFEWEQWRRPFYEWKQLKEQVRRHFSSSPTPSRRIQSDVTQFDDVVRHQSYSLGHGCSGEARFTDGRTDSPRSGSVGAPEENEVIKVLSEKTEVTYLEKTSHGSPSSFSSYGSWGKFGKNLPGGVGEGDFIGDFISGYVDIRSTTVSPLGGFFKRDDMRGSGSGGDHGLMAGKSTIGGGTATCGDRNGEGNGFVKGGSGASGSGGGPGYLSSTDTGGGPYLFVSDEFGGANGRRSWQMRLQKIPEVVPVGGCMNDFFASLEKKPSLEDASKGNTVKYLKDAIISEYWWSEARDFNQSKEQLANKDIRNQVGLSNLKPTSFYKMRHHSEPTKLNPISLSSYFQLSNSNSKPTYELFLLMKSPIHPSKYELPNSLTPQTPCPFQKNMNGLKADSRPRILNVHFSTLTNPPFYMPICISQSSSPLKKDKQAPL